MGVGIRSKFSRLELSAKVNLVLVATIVPVFSVLILLENQATIPVLSEELRQLGVATATSLESEIVSRKLMARPDATAVIERLIQETLYIRPNIKRIEVWRRNPDTEEMVLTATNIEPDPQETEEANRDDSNPDQSPESVVGVSKQKAWASSYSSRPISEQRSDERGHRYWFVRGAIEKNDRKDLMAHPEKRWVGEVQVSVSLDLVEEISGSLFRIKLFGAAVSVLVLVATLRFFLRRTLENESRLRSAESENIVLSSRLRETEIQLFQSEKLAAMGQLTATLAHEIGTPLNAISGHLQLLREEATESHLGTSSRWEVIQNQVDRIASTVRGFLSSLSAPPTRRERVVVLESLKKTLEILEPELRRGQIDVLLDEKPPVSAIRIAPLEFEQIVMNLVKNSLDSLRAIPMNHPKKLSFRLMTQQGRTWLYVRDTGQGIMSQDLPRVLEPFFTTKPVGQGTGLGLAICAEIAQRNNGLIEVASEWGSWTEVRLGFPVEGAPEANLGGMESRS